MTQSIDIPTIDDEAWDFAQLFRIYEQVNSGFEDARFDFSHCTFLRPNAVAFLGGLARLIESRQGTIVVDWNTICSKRVLMNLRQNGFAGAFGYPSSAWDGHSIPYREDRVLNMNGIMDYLTDYWIGKGWVHVSERLRDAIAGRMWEIYCNAFEHSNTDVGVFSCGQHFPNKNELVLSVIDFGLGIPAKIRDFLGDDPRAKGLPADRCLRWAFTRGKSTCRDMVPRGIGLDLLKEFVRINHGKLEVYSNEGYAVIDSNDERYLNLETTFKGTLFHITLRCDEKLYQFRDEAI